MLKKYRVRRFAAIIFTLLVISASAYSQRFVAFIDGPQETPPSGSTGTGYGHVVVSPDGTQITVNMGFSGLGTAASAAHIHTAPVGVAGPVTFGLSGVPAATSGVIPQQTFAISPAQLADLLAGNMYFNIHTGGFPGGEIRGQILPPSCTLASNIEVQATAGTLITGYPDVAAAFNAINNGTHQGAIDVEVCGNTSETATAALNSGAVAPAAYTSVNVYPVGAARTVTGSIIGAIIKLNGADNVTIDGRIGGTGRNLTVSNSNTSAATAAIWLASVAAGNGASGNVVRNLELAAGATQNTTSNSTFGIIMCGTTISTTANGVDNDNNSFIANRVIRARYGIVTRGTTTDLNINPVVTDNIVGPTSFGADQIGKVGIFMQADTGALVSRNTVQFVGGDFANTTGGADRVGIGIGSESWSMTPGTLTSNTYTVTRNVIHDIVEERTFSSLGINLGTTGGGSATNNLVANNFIYNVKANSTAGDQATGLGIAGGHTDVVVNNSISMTGDVDPTPAASASSNFGSGIRIGNANGTTHLNLTLSNNSVYMDLSSSSGPTVRYYAISGPINTYAFGTGGENNNNLYINPANTQLQTGGLGTTSGVALTTQFATLANWQTAYTAPQDAASIQANPNYASTTADLHITGASPNINVGTTIAAVTVDIDNEARPNGAAYDIGADEFYPSPGVLQLSSATYGGNEGTSVTVTVNRVSGSSGTVGVTATLADGSATGGAGCGVGVDYVNPGPQVLSFGDTVTSQTFNVTLCTDAVTDPSEMFTITLSLPTGSATLGSPTVATATITDVPPPFTGAYTVGGGGNYPSLTNPGGIFEAINLGGASGNVTINITSDLTGETGAFALNEIAGGFTVLLKPSGAPRTITGSINGALIKLNGADNVRIDGSTAAMFADELVGGNPALRQLTIQNTNTGTAAVVVSFGSGINGAQNNTIRNVNVVGQDPLTTLLGISIGGNTPGTVGTDNDNNRVQNCSVQKSIFGIYAAGQSAANPDLGTVITENDLTGTGANRVRRVGILVFNQNGIEISENYVRGLDTNESADAIGIGVGTQGVDTTTVTSGGVINATVTRNRIVGVTGNASLGFSAAGITVAGGTGGANVISNNEIAGVIANSTSPDIVAGIYVVGATGSNTRVIYNSVAMTGNRGATASQTPSYAIAITGVDPTVELKNNVFYNTQDPGSGGVNAKSYGIGMVTTTFVNLDSDFNDFFIAGPNPGFFRSGSLTTAAGTDYATLAAWQAAVADDANSVAVDPLFIDPLENLRLQPTSPVRNIGTPIAGITVDKDNQTRPNPTDSLVVQVDIGADEFYAPTAAPASISGRVLTADGSGVRNATVIVSGGDLPQPIIVKTGSFGKFAVEGLMVGQTYIVTVVSRRYAFDSPSRVVTLSSNVTDLDFVGSTP